MAEEKVRFQMRIDPDTDRKVKAAMPLGDRPVCKVTVTDVQALYREVQKNGRKIEHPKYRYTLSSSTIRSLHGVFHQAMDTAVQERFMEEVKKDPVNPGRAYSRLKTLLKSAGLPVIRFHELSTPSPPCL